MPREDASSLVYSDFVCHHQKQQNFIRTQADKFIQLQL